MDVRRSSGWRQNGLAAEIRLLLEQRGLDFRGRLIDEPLAVQARRAPPAVRPGPARARRGRAAASASTPARAVDADRASRARGRRCDRAPRSRRSWSRRRSRPSVGLVDVEGFQGDPQDLGNFFLEGDDRLRPRQLALQPTVLRLRAVSRGDRPDLGLRSAPARAPGDELALVALPTPVRQVRTVQPFATQQRAQLPGLLARVGFLEDAEPILRSELPALDLGRHFRVGGGGARRGRGTGRSGRPPGSLRLRPLGHVQSLRLQASDSFIEPSPPLH